jgi:hypothetical protein
MAGRFDPSPVSDLVRHDWAAALREARVRPDAWGRAQGLGWAARFAPDAEVVAIAEEALAACASAADPYERVGASAWPLRALIERGHAARAAAMLGEVLLRAEAIENPVSRVDALFLVWQAVYPLGSEVRRTVLAPLLRTAVATNAWKPQRVLQVIVYILAEEEPSLADEVAAAMPPGQYQRAAARRLAGGERQELRPFFWPQGGG